ncbi:fibronectin type III domain-containing protein, partial [candidate division KSB1 bacterium]|nr:fibronectin type III domain-containing protein [candidate division KSB1 bacterium]
TISATEGGTTNPPPGRWEFSANYLAYCYAFPDSDFQFIEWTGDIPVEKKYDNPLSIDMPFERSITANFAVAVPPTKPELLYPVNKTVVPSDSILFRWKKEKYASHYYLHIASDSLSLNPIYSDTVYADTMRKVSILSDGRAYDWQLQAANSIGMSDFSEINSFFTELNEPVNLTASLQKPTEVQLTWQDKSQSEAGFIIERKTGDSLSTMEYLVIDTLKANQTLFADTSVSDTTVYTYRVNTFNDLMNSEYSNPAQIKTRLTGVNELNHAIPEQFVLFPNFPNPFNPSTRIKYGIPRESMIEITLFNILGKRVQILVQKQQPAGYYEIIFDATQLASGIYLLAMQGQEKDGTETFKAMKRILLLK